MDSTWVRTSRNKMLDWFSSLDYQTIEKIWIYSKDLFDPNSRKSLFVCRSCSSFAYGIECSEDKNYKDCEKELDKRISCKK